MFPDDAPQAKTWSASTLCRHGLPVTPAIAACRPPSYSQARRSRQSRMRVLEEVDLRAQGPCSGPARPPPARGGGIFRSGPCWPSSRTRAPGHEGAAVGVWSLEAHAYAMDTCQHRMDLWEGRGGGRLDSTWIVEPFNAPLGEWRPGPSCGFSR